MGKVSQKTIEEQLLSAREEGLSNSRDLHAMKAHGKTAGMDVFSWVNPEVDALGAVLTSMPFKIIWLASKSQVQNLLSVNENALENVESLVIYDAGKLDLEYNWLNSKTSIGCVDDVPGALELLSSLKGRERIFLYTLPSDNWTLIKNRIDLKLKTWN
ncbi:MAG: hypothetical protein ACI865_000413 [Flavobacteriaceae bacterium]|jgi:hypothetical protein